MASLFEAPEVEFNLKARKPNEPLLDFFKRKAAAQIDLSLNQVTHRQTYVKGKKNYLKIVDDTADSENRSPSPKRSKSSGKTQKTTTFRSPRKSPQKLAAEDKARESVETNRDYARVKEMLMKRGFSLESAVAQLKGFKKGLAQIKLTTNRELLIKQANDVEASSDQIARELEKLISANHDAGRQVEKLWQQVEIERSQAREEWAGSLKFELENAQAAADAEIEDLKAQLEENKGRALRADIVEELEGQLRALRLEHKQLIKSCGEKDSYIGKHSNDLTVMGRNLEERNQEIDRLEKDLEHLQRLVRTQEANYDQQVTELNREVTSLTSHLEAFRQNEEYKLILTNESKDNEISKLHAELARCQEELSLKFRNSKREDEIRHKELLELRSEVSRLHSQQERLEQADSRELMELRAVLQEKEAAYRIEIDRMAEELQKSDQYRLKQKNEWAEIYTSLKHEIKDLKVKLNTMSIENEKMLRHHERSQHDTIDAELSLKAQNDTLRTRIRDRETEVNSLWDVLLELQKTQNTRGKIDFRDLQTLLVIKNLDDKWRRKLR